MKRNLKPYTQEEFNTVLSLLDDGVSYETVARRIGRTSMAIEVIRTGATAYKKTGRIISSLGKKNQKYLMQYYGQEHIKIEPLPTPPQTATNGVTKPSSEDNLKKLEQAFLIFQESLIEVIDAEAKRRAEALVADKEKEMVALKAKYEKELIRHQEILLAAQNSSMVGVLKKKWLGI